MKKLLSLVVALCLVPMLASADATEQRRTELAEQVVTGLQEELIDADQKFDISYVIDGRNITVNIVCTPEFNILLYKNRDDWDMTIFNNMILCTMMVAIESKYIDDIVFKYMASDGKDGYIPLADVSGKFGIMDYTKPLTN